MRAAAPSPTIDALVKLAELRQEDLPIEEEYESEKGRLAPPAPNPFVAPNPAPASSPPSAAPPVMSSPSKIDALLKLAELRQKDLLSAEEYNREKAKLLEQP